MLSMIAWLGHLDLLFNEYVAWSLDEEMLFPSKELFFWWSSLYLDGKLTLFVFFNVLASESKMQLQKLS